MTDSCAFRLWYNSHAEVFVARNLTPELPFCEVRGQLNHSTLTTSSTSNTPPCLSRCTGHQREMWYTRGASTCWGECSYNITQNCEHNHNVGSCWLHHNVPLGCLSSNISYTSSAASRRKVNFKKLTRGHSASSIRNPNIYLTYICLKGPYLRG